MREPVAPHGVAWLGHNLPSSLRARTVWCARVELENRGTLVWKRDHPEGRRVDLVVYRDDTVWSTHGMPRAEVRPGERVTLLFPLRVPDHGVHHLRIDLVEQGVTSFAARGASALELELRADAEALSRSAELHDRASRLAPWHDQPTKGVGSGPKGSSYPLFVARARGCHFWDVEGRQYLDYVMGWGCALLGYAEPRVQAAVRDALDSGAVVPLPHPLEIEVAGMLAEDLPCAERVVFGKNGSDVCTLAARVARVFTGRPVILYSGYHGWQDWWAEQAGFAATGIPDRPRPLLHRFRFNDLADFRSLYERHRHDLAAVMLEPSGPVSGPNGAEGDAEPGFLAALAGAARDAGALLVFDEILTGFRYPGGGVQRASGVVPDLACVGKALSAGMPLSALVGRARVLESAMGRTHYGPTFRGEVYSLAAARVALGIYREEPVARHVWSHGLRLREGIDALCARHGVAAACAGPPFRMTLSFREDDPERLALKRTLYGQELLKAGLMTHDGFMLPSYAHDEAALAWALKAVDGALAEVAAADREDDFPRRLEIPPR